MKTAGMVLGIIGAAFALIICISMLFGLIIGGIALQHEGIADKALKEAQAQLEDEGFEYNLDNIPFSNLLGGLINFGFGIGFFFAITGLVGGVLGLIGGIRIKKSNVVSGVFLMIAALFTIWLFIPFILFIIAGIFAFIKDNKTQAVL